MSKLWKKNKINLIISLRLLEFTACDEGTNYGSGSPTARNVALEECQMDSCAIGPGAIEGALQELKPNTAVWEDQTAVFG